MNSKYLFFLGMMAMVASCDPNDSTNEPSELEGQYTGTFNRNGTITNVTLNLDSDAFTGTSEVEKFPGICAGNYNQETDSITFINACNWTAEFDWTLILGEKWGYTLNGNTLILTKANGDIYTLTKE